MEIKKLEKEVIDCLKEFEFISDPEELNRHTQKLLNILTELKEKNPSERDKYEEVASRLLEFSEMHSSRLCTY